MIQSGEEEGGLFLFGNIEGVGKPGVEDSQALLGEVGQIKGPLEDVFQGIA